MQRKSCKHSPIPIWALRQSKLIKTHARPPGRPSSSPVCVRVGSPMRGSLKEFRPAWAKFGTRSSILMKFSTPPIHRLLLSQQHISITIDSTKSEFTMANNNWQQKFAHVCNSDLVCLRVSNACPARAYQILVFIARITQMNR